MSPTMTSHVESNTKDALARKFGLVGVVASIAALIGAVLRSDWYQAGISICVAGTFLIVLTTPDLKDAPARKLLLYMLSFGSVAFLAASFFAS